MKIIPKSQVLYRMELNSPLQLIQMSNKAKVLDISCTYNGGIVTPALIIQSPTEHFLQKNLDFIPPDKRAAFFQYKKQSGMIWRAFFRSSHLIDHLEGQKDQWSKCIYLGNRLCGPTNYYIFELVPKYAGAVGCLKEKK